MKLILVGVFAAFLATAGYALADDYPQWRGPNRDGIAKDKGLLKQWPAGGPKLRWQGKNLGSGWSTPSVAKGQIYLVGSPDKKTEHVIALRESDGTQLWATKIGNVGPNTKAPYPGPRSTPTVDGNRLYALGSDGDLACLDTAKGDILWKKSYRKDFDGVPGFWAFSESVLVDGDKVICCPGGKKATLAALNKADGKVVWECAIPEGDQAGYASAIVAEVDGVRQYIQFMSKGVVGVEAKTGKFLWRYSDTEDSTGAMNCSTPIFHNGLVLTSSISKGSGLVKLTAADNKVSATQVYLNNKLQNHHGGLVLVDDHVYGTTGQALVCIEFKTGKEKWTNRSVGKGSLCYAEGCLYVRGESGGPVALVECSPAGYKELGRFTPPGSSSKEVWCYPVVANGCLYLRDQANLFCYDVKIGENKTDLQAKEAATRFFKALMARDIDALMAAADVPWSDEKHDVVKDRQELKKVFVEAVKGFDKSVIAIDSYQAGRVAKYGDVRHKLKDYQADFVQFVDQVLRDDDRVVVLEFMVGKETETTLLYVRIRDGNAKVVGGAKDWLREGKP